MSGRENRGLKVLAGGHQDYELLYRQHQARILRLCQMMLSDPEEAAEVCQEVFFKAFRQYRSNNQPEKWSPWLTRVAVNACHDRRRSWWWRWLRKSEEFVDADFADRGATPEQTFAGREQARKIWESFQQLSPRQREVFVLRHLEGWSTDEVAEALNLSNGSVKRHLFRAVRELRETLGERS